MVAARYINKELALVFLVTLLVLLIVAVGGRFVGYLQDAATGKYAAEGLLTLMRLRISGFLQLLLPFAFYISVLLTFGRLYADHEMAVLLAGGASPGRLLRWIALPVVILASSVAYLALEVTPSNNAKLQAFILEQRTRAEFETVTPGVFNILNRGKRVTYAERISDDRQTLTNVFISEYAPDEPVVTVWAERGNQYVDEQTGSRFLVLEDGTRYLGTIGSKDYRVIEFERLGQRLIVEAVVTRGPEADAVPTVELLGRDDAEAAAEIHWRIALPIFCLVSVVVAVGIARVKPRQGRFAKVVPGMAFVLAYFFALIANQNALLEADWPPMLGMWLVHAVFLALGSFLFMRVGKPVSA